MTQNERLETVIAAARQHGEDSEPDQEVGDLQDCLRAAVSCMDLDQFDMFMRTPAVVDALEWAGNMKTRQTLDRISRQTLDRISRQTWIEINEVQLKPRLNSAAEYRLGSRLYLSAWLLVEAAVSFQCVDQVGHMVFSRMWRDETK